jgi:hypothetical protein
MDRPPPDLNDVAHSRFDAMEMRYEEPFARIAVENWIEEPGRQLREYRFKLNSKRRALIRDALIALIDQIDADLRTLRQIAGSDPGDNGKLEPEAWSDLCDHLTQIEVLLGSSVKKPNRWSDLMHHAHLGFVGDYHDVATHDWPQVKAELRKGLYGANEPLPMQVDDLGSLVAAKPSGPITTQLNWSKLDDQAFERLIFSLISDTAGYENPEWLMQTRAPDRGRDLSVTRIIQDALSGTLRLRVVIQCKHWLSRSVSLPEVGAAKDQMATWINPRVDVLVIATSGRFTADAVTWIEGHNASGMSPWIEMWPESHLERLLAARPAFIAEFGLRGSSEQNSAAFGEWPTPRATGRHIDGNPPARFGDPRTTRSCRCALAALRHGARNISTSPMTLRTESRERWPRSSAPKRWRANCDQSPDSCRFAGAILGAIPRARARARRVVPISELVFGALTQNRSSLEPSLGFAAIARHIALWISYKPLKSRCGTPKGCGASDRMSMVVPVPPPVRKINSKGAVLNARHNDAALPGWGLVATGARPATTSGRHDPVALQLCDRSSGTIGISRGVSYVNGTAV